jgi:serine/threonine protein kinase
MAKGRYRIIRKIADGGMAEIYAGTQHGVEGFERPVVLKRILPTLLVEPQFKNMMIDEAHVAMSLTHGNIVQVLDLGQAKGHYYLVLELVDGWDLNQILNRLKAVRGIELPPTLALFIVSETCRALAYAHSRRRGGRPMGIVHRDISPHNILVSAEGEVKLTDFGIAKAMVRRENTVEGVIKGKLAFMSPEQAAGAAIDSRSDLFSLGTLLYLMFTGKRPFEAPTDLESILRVQKADFAAPESVRPDIAVEVATIIKKSMMLRPSERFQTADAMLEAIEDVQRQVFGASGKTELKRWLADLEKKDHMPSIGRLPLVAKATPDDTLELGDHDIEFEGSDVGPVPTVSELGATISAANASSDNNGVVRNEIAFAPTSGKTRAEKRTPPPPLPGMPAVETGTATTATSVPNKSRRAYFALAVVGIAVVAWVKFSGKSPSGATSPLPEPAPPVLPPTSVEEAAPVTTLAAPDAATEAAADAGAETESDPEENEDLLLAHAESNIDQTVIGDDDADQAEKATKPKPNANAAKTSSKLPLVVSVKIVSKPAGAVVKLDKRVFGRAPMNLRFKAGVTYQLTFVKAGYVPLTKKLTVSRKANQSLSVTLRKHTSATKKNFIQRILGL